MNLKKPIAVVAALALAGGGWAVLRWRIRAGAVAGSAFDTVRPHHNQPPHGGTPVVLGDDQFHMELVRDPAAGLLRAYILDGEMEDFVRISARGFTILVDRGGRQDTLTFQPVADLATGETVGDTSLFQARADWLRQTDHFKGVIQTLPVQDQTFKAVAFGFPEGSGKD
ncbi:MAG: hypothetical protein P4L36_02505 [Holophaga sp.]|nr:hypothetical protein [Holophaga sp.]